MADDNQAALAEAVEQWRTLATDHALLQGRRFADLTPDMERAQRDLIADQAAEAAEHLHHFMADNRDRSAEELHRIAFAVSPGGAHTGALLGQLVGQLVPFADPLLRAAVIACNWRGGKAGFQFLPDPATVDLIDYEEEALALLDGLAEATEGDPLRILVGRDAAFYRALPERLTVYRGCCGLDEETAARGVCWTTRRDVADWFAARLAEADQPPIVLTARVPKARIVLAFADEHEVVCMPARARRIAARPDRPPPTPWTPAQPPGA